MGGLFRASEPPPAPPAAQPAAPPSSRAAADEQRARRLAAIEARKRGMTGTVATSWRGVLADALPPASRKSLLGE